MRNELPIALLDTLPNPIAIKDDQLRYVWVNAAFEQLFGATYNDLVGCTSAELEDDRLTSCCNANDLQGLDVGDIDEARNTIDSPNGEPRHMLTRTSVIDVHDGRFLIEVMSDMTEINETNDLVVAQSLELETIASTDPLTGCLNRHAFFGWWDELPANLTGHGIVAIAVDDLKVLNNLYGHDAGDAALVQAVATIYDHVNPGDFLTRFGGGEFVAVLRDRTATNTRLLAEEIREAIGQMSIETTNGPAEISASIGVAHLRDPRPADLNVALSAADQDLFLAKQQRKSEALTA